MIDNSQIVADFVPETDDEDTFLYTELLDRSKDKCGSNRVRLLRTFYHRSRAGFWDVWPAIKEMCDKNGVRAYTRLSPRSFAKVGKLATTLMLEAALVGHFKDMMHIYSRACGRVSPNTKLWLYDIDEDNAVSEAAISWLLEKELFVREIPSRKGCHIICKPHQPPRGEGGWWPGISVHKDNPTNLYIPDSAK